MAIRVDGSSVCIQMEAAEWLFDTSGGFRLSGVRNRLSGRDLAIYGTELTVGLDQAGGRIWIDGWRIKAGGSDNGDPDLEEGYADGWARADFDDASWATSLHPIYHVAGGTYVWSRTSAVIPESWRARPVRLLLGGFGLHDFRWTRVFVNGRQVAVREKLQQNADPEILTLTEDLVRFDGENVIAIQARESWNRTGRLDELDPEARMRLPHPSVTSATYLQCLVSGESESAIRFECIDAGASGAESLSVTLKAIGAPITASITYQIEASGAVVRRRTRIVNDGPDPLTLMTVELGDYSTTCPVTDGEMGLPVFIAGEAFAGICHPAGWSQGYEEGRIRLRHFPGRVIMAGESYQAMDSVLGVSAPSEVAAAFRAYLTSHSRRVARGHDGPRVIFEPYGGWERDPERWRYLGGLFEEGFLSENPTEEAMLHFTGLLHDFAEKTGRQFDAFSLDFWCDPSGDYIKAKTPHFTNGSLDTIRDAVLSLNMDFGLWIDSTCGHWGIGLNPAIEPSRVDSPAYQMGNLYCRASEPLQAMFTDGFAHHVRKTGARLLKFDNGHFYCNNRSHNHLPGLYSLEPVSNALIEFLRHMDAECSDVFLMLYWGYGSPWWLLDADTLFETGLFMEAASPSPQPSLYVRDGVTVGLDQGLDYAQALPRLGHDSLGVWLSDWPWNSGIGRERWQEAFIMDLCRGSMLEQLWTDWDFLNPADRAQLAYFIRIFKERPACFAASKPVLGSPWRTGPYGYACANGAHGFLAVNNSGWSDEKIELRLDDGWGFDAGPKRLYRLHPAPARLIRPDGSDIWESSVTVWARPFEVALFGVSSGDDPLLETMAARREAVSPYEEASRDLNVKAVAARCPSTEGPAARFDSAVETRNLSRLTVDLPASRGGGILVLTAEVKTPSGKAAVTQNVGSRFKAGFVISGAETAYTPVLGDETYGASWQAWRVHLPPQAAGSIDAAIADAFPSDHEIVFRGHFIPA